MATMNISLPDSLKEEMNKYPAIVWSRVAVKAFENEIIENNKTIEVTDMTQAIARLQATKQSYDNTLKTDGYQYGLEWAMKYADYRELQELKQFVSKWRMPKDIPEIEKILEDYSVEFDDIRDFDDSELCIKSSSFAEGLVTAALEVLEKVD